ncbi:unnamed protein product [Wickerhamomyces anomalus]
MDGFTRLRHQAAGHEGPLADEAQTLFVKPSTRQEIEFYTQVQRVAAEEESQGKDVEGDRLIDFMPVFMGTLEAGITSKVEETTQVSEELRKLDLESNKKNDEQPYLVLQNALKGFNNPSIIDIKLGSILHDEFTSQEKKARLQKVSETTTSGSLNYRVCGMKLYHDQIPDLFNFDKEHVSKTDDGYLVFDKWFGRSLTPTTVVDNFKIYFQHNKLSSIQQRILLLFIHENDPKRWEELNNEDQLFKQDFLDDDDDDDDDDNEQPAPLSAMYLIDFAHAKFTPGKGVDENIIKGVENILDALDRLVNE